MNYLDAADPDLIAKHKGLWVCVSEYGIILICASTKEELERLIVPYHGCGLQLVHV